MSLAKYGQLLRAIAEGQDPAALGAPAELLATLVLGVDRPEWGWLQQEYRYVGYVRENAAVGDTSKVLLWNPPGSNVMVLVQHVHGLTEGSYVTLAQGESAGGFVSDGTEYPTDYRCRVGTDVARAPAALIYSGFGSFTGNALVRVAFHAALGTDFSYSSRIPFVVLPGTGLVVNGSTTNQYVQAAFEWIERAMDPQEIAGAAGV
jgi:hypothetical protein